ncbi:MAG: hypothetical protein ACOX6T_20135 [Myxococcales bacterium]|jgi:hypothetical protein
MNAALGLALLVLAQAPARPEVLFAEAPPVEVWVSEDWPVESLGDLARLPGTSVGLRTRSNMLRPELASAVARGAFLVELSPPIVEAHVDQFRRLTRAHLVIGLPEKPGEELRSRLSYLGPQPLRLRADRLDAARAAWLAGLKNAEVELDLRGRIPEQDELGLFLGLHRARRVVRLRASDPPEILEGIRLARPVRVVVETDDNRVPGPMLAALARLDCAVRIRLAAGATADELLRFSHLGRVSFELSLGDDAPSELPGLAALLGSVSLQSRALPASAPSNEGEGKGPQEASVKKSAPGGASSLDRAGGAQ